MYTCLHVNRRRIVVLIFQIATINFTLCYSYIKGYIFCYESEFRKSYEAMPLLFIDTK